jgi:hypothetical protein
MMTQIVNQVALKPHNGPEREEKEKAGENCIMKSFMICTAHKYIIQVVTSRRMRWQACGAEEKYVEGRKEPTWKT